MKLGIVYFSGTGNTAWVAQRLAEQLHALGDEATAFSCEETPAVQLDVGTWDVLGIAFPVHSSFATPVFRDHLEQLPPADKPLFAITTAGYWAGDTAWYAAQPLTRRGYKLFLCANVLMPNNFFIPKMDVLPVTPPERVPRFLERATRRVADLAERIHTQECHIEGTDIIGRLGGALQRWGYTTFEHRMLARFSADDRCTGCGWCVGHCPTQSWELRDGKAPFSGSLYVLYALLQLLPRAGDPGKRQDPARDQIPPVSGAGRETVSAITLFPRCYGAAKQGRDDRWHRRERPGKRSSPTRPAIPK